MAQVSGKFLKSSTYIQETPSGTINGSNVTFTLANTPVAITVVVFLDGMYQKPTTHYTISGSTITMVTAPGTNQDIAAIYWRKA